MKLMHKKKLYFVFLFFVSHIKSYSADDTLLEAIDEGDRRFVQGYLAGGGDPNALDYKNRSLLERAAGRGKKDIVVDLIQKDADVHHEDDAGNTPLYMASLGGYADIVRVLINQGVDVNQADKRGLTGFHKACDKGHVDVIREIVTVDSLRIDQATKDGRTAIWFACRSGNKAYIEKSSHVHVFEEIVQLLLHNGASPGQEDEEGTSLLHWSCYEGHLTMVDLLMRYGAKVNHQRFDGTTPLMVACFFGHQAIANLLMSAGPDLFLTACEELGGGTAYHYALQQGYEGLASTLQKLMVSKQSEIKQKELDQSVAVMEQLADKINFLSKKMADLESDGQKNTHKMEELSYKMTDLSLKSDEPVKAITKELKLVKEKLESFDHSELDHEHQIASLREQHQRLWDVYRLESDLEAEKRSLLENPLLSSFYSTIFGKLHGIFSSYQMLDVGMLQRGTVNKWDRVGQGISLVGNVVPLPCSNLVISALRSGAGFMADRASQKHVRFIVKLVRNPELSFKETEESARLLTRTYQDQIQGLTEKGVVCLAECAVGRLMAFIQAEQIRDDIELSSQFLDAVASFSSRQGLFGFRDQSIETITKYSPAWSDKGIFQKTGIQTTDGSYFISSTDDQSSRYGFRKSSDEQARKLGFIRKR